MGTWSGSMTTARHVGVHASSISSAGSPTRSRSTARRDAVSTTVPNRTSAPGQDLVADLPASVLPRVSARRPVLVALAALIGATVLGVSVGPADIPLARSEEHTSELQSLR